MKVLAGALAGMIYSAGLWTAGAPVGFLWAVCVTLAVYLVGFYIGRNVERAERERPD